MKEKSAGIKMSEGIIRIAIIEQDNDLVTIDKIEEIPYADLICLNQTKRQ